MIVGSGGREHALAWKLRQSDKLTDLFVAPGNAGTARIATNLEIKELDFSSLFSATREHRIGLVVIGPEAPLADGIVDYLSERGVLAYGPTAAAARIEASKVWAKQVMLARGIPTAPASVFDDAAGARRFVRDCVEAPVVKADGLAAGKGVVVARNQTEALAAIELAMTDRVFGNAGNRVLLEQRIVGQEVSAHAFCDGVRALAMPYACDHKAIFDGDRGPNTGGMGAYSPPGSVDERLAEEIAETVTRATIRALADEGVAYRGTLYPGLMITNDGPKVIEFNCRFGDPETQVIMPRLRSDLLPILVAAAEGDLSCVSPEWDDGASLGVVMASGGYPGSYSTGYPISGLEAVDADVLVFQSGTAVDAAGRTVTAGGRVLTVVARGATIAAARERAYENVHRILYDGAYFRTDIGLRGGDH